MWPENLLENFSDIICVFDAGIPMDGFFFRLRVLGIAETEDFSSKAHAVRCLKKPASPI